jgi:hypothetical protein
VIHEFDPYFNYRTTQFLVEEGLSNFHNWFDDRAWYPLGRIVGGTIYPGERRKGRETERERDGKGERRKGRETERERDRG